jgi:hypothetical protein
MQRWWSKFLKRVPFIVIHPSAPTWKCDVEHWHIVTIFGFELAILVLKRVVIDEN